ncbi:hypothetical protein B7P43_G02730 [Cryptotermes secundus]|nr:hypothetical protein B7P43_G02730 [Cryptotermes secundus]
MKRLAHLLSKQIAMINKQEPDTRIDANDEFCHQPHSTSQASDAVYKSVANRNTVELETEDVTVEDFVSSVKKAVSKSETAVEYDQKSYVECEKSPQREAVKDLAQNRNNVMKNPELREKSCSKGAFMSHQHRRRHHPHSRKRAFREKKGALFEGERVSYLVGQCEAEEAHPSAGNGEQKSVQEDDYVLRKLFRKSGIQTAMRHDMIMEGGHADYALVEGEARRVAKEAVQALKESRRQCWQADTGVPSWTGQSGALRSHNISPTQARLRFGKKKTVTRSSVSVSESKSKGSRLDASNEEPMTSSELLSRMQIRNRLMEPVARPEPDSEEELTQGYNNIPVSSSVSVQEEHAELLTDIRNYVAFGASVDGRASTQEILAQFSERLPPGTSPLFKFMLSEVCEFHRMPSGEGVWRLRSEFRW